mmetsp:Transcript_24674/g.65818  ORF Transcript_24674/g.65818 Transcript_24674/m.65818 type:complete len:89 (+) Transcript_24674:133-399(+)
MPCLGSRLALPRRELQMRGRYRGLEKGFGRAIAAASGFYSDAEPGLDRAGYVEPRATSGPSVGSESVHDTELNSIARTGQAEVVPLFN